MIRSQFNTSHNQKQLHPYYHTYCSQNGIEGCKLREGRTLSALAVCVRPKANCYRKTSRNVFVDNVDMLLPPLTVITAKRDVCDISCSKPRPTYANAQSSITSRHVVHSSHYIQSTHHPSHLAKVNRTELGVLNRVVKTKFPFYRFDAPRAAASIKYAPQNTSTHTCNKTKQS